MVVLEQVATVMKPVSFSPVVALGLLLAWPVETQAQLGAAKRAAQRVATSGSQRQLPDDKGNVPAQYQGVRPVAPAPAPVAVPAAPAKPVDPAKQAADKDAAVQRLVALQKEQAEKGRPGSQYDLGMRYLKGDGVPADPKLGREWIAKSAAQGESEAVKKLKELDAAAAAPAKK
jgi:TPR repeat protein